MEQGTPNEVEGMTESQPLMRMRSANGDAPLQMKKEGWRRIIVAAVGLLLIFTVAVVKSTPSSHSTSSALDVEKLSFSFQTISDYTTFEAGQAYRRSISNESWKTSRADFDQARRLLSEAVAPRSTEN